MSRPLIVDTHTHIFTDEFRTDRSEMLTRARQVCQALVLPNIDEDTTESLLALCAANPDFCFPALGLHPSSVPEHPEEVLSRLEQMLDAHAWVGIGETGLDLYWDPKNLPRQEISLHRHIDWALGKNLPLILHTRDAIPETIALIRTRQNGNLKGVFHCFTGTAEEAKEIMDLGFFIGIGGVITYPKSDLKQVLASVDRSRVVLETDSPWLPPVPYRGKRNEPAYIRQVAEAVALSWFISIDEAIRITTENAMRLFDLPGLIKQ